MVRAQRHAVCSGHRGHMTRSGHRGHTLHPAQRASLLADETFLRQQQGPPQGTAGQQRGLAGNIHAGSDMLAETQLPSEVARSTRHGLLSTPAGARSQAPVGAMHGLDTGLQCVSPYSSRAYAHRGEAHTWNLPRAQAMQSSKLRQRSLTRTSTTRSSCSRAALSLACAAKLGRSEGSRPCSTA
jgi:hypothetical protein